MNPYCLKYFKKSRSHLALDMDRPFMFFDCENYVYWTCTLLIAITCNAKLRRVTNQPSHPPTYYLHIIGIFESELQYSIPQYIQFPLCRCPYKRIKGGN